MFTFNNLIENYERTKSEILCQEQHIQFQLKNMKYQIHIDIFCRAIISESVSIKRKKCISNGRMFFYAFLLQFLFQVYTAAKNEQYINTEHHYVKTIESMLIK